MTATPAFIEELIADLPHILRAAARQEVLPRFRNLAPGDVRLKTSETDLATDADTGAERVITDAVRGRWPSVAVVGEEAVFHDQALLDQIAAADVALIVDPVDGTWNFAHGLPVFSMMAAVTVRGRTEYGIIYDPLNDDYIHGRRGGGAFHVGPHGASPLTVAPARPFAEMMGYVQVGLFPPEDHPRMALAATAFRRAGTLRCSAYEYRMLCQGSAAFCMNALLAPWDHAAGQLIHAEAGGYSALLDGTPYAPTLTQGRLLLAPDHTSWAALRDHFTAA